MSNRVIHFPEQGLPGSLVAYTEAAGPEPVELEPRGAVEVPDGTRLVYAADVTGESLAAFATFPPDVFTVIDLAGASDAAVEAVRGQHGLRTLVLSGDFTDQGVEALDGLTSLADLVLESPRFTGAGLAALVGSPTLASLETLILAGGGAFDPASLRALAGAHGLSSLTVENTPVDDALADAVLTLTPELTDLSLAERPGHAPDPAVLERLLSAGLAVNGVAAPAEHAAAFAPLAAAAAEDAHRDEDAEEFPEEEAQGGVLAEVTDEEQLDGLLSGPTPVLVELTAPWCGPCQALTPVLEKVVEEYAGAVRGVTVDIDAAPWASARFDALGVPAVLLFRDGTPVSRFHGVWPPRRITAWLTAAGIHPA
ncbi:thioredoxin family protein [Streptomyces sp. NPDC053048]|uniref:thioredoxin family protein n=1 Tax=Streptomyces sp. NPDC053048 TaxID=3365694 RepID=UPI0037CD492B